MREIFMISRQQLIARRALVEENGQQQPRDFVEKLLLDGEKLGDIVEAAQRDLGASYTQQQVSAIRNRLEKRYSIRIYGKSKNGLSPRQLIERRAFVEALLQQGTLTYNQIQEQVQRELGMSIAAMQISHIKKDMDGKDVRRVRLKRAEAKKARVKKVEVAETALTRQPPADLNVHIVARHPVEDLVEKLHQAMRQDGDIVKVEVEADGNVSIVRREKFRLPT
jgi:hypothetical protein